MGSRRSVEEIFKDYNGRRNGIIKALTTDVENFFGLCDPEKDNLCLYGHPDDSWEVTLPAEEVPPELPEPALGINFARDGMARSDWLSLVAVHSDSWLISVAFYLGAFFNANERKRLFTLINDLPTVFEVVSGKVRKERLGGDSGSKSRLSTNVEVVSGKVPKDRLDGDGGSRSKHSIKRTSDGQVKNNSKLTDETYGVEEDEEDHNETYCGSCAGIYNSDEFWIMCDMCERWYHGKCVRITPAKAENIKHYKCPYCRARP